MHFPLHLPAGIKMLFDPCDHAPVFGTDRTADNDVLFSQRIDVGLCGGNFIQFYE